ncbi:MAG: MCE family protein, partial [Spongiibacteraceae bacterium]|nr:MCE family protein [Spongiibacteraceae bacterium]
MSNENLAEVEEKSKGRLSAIWILPVLAALIGGWLIYKAISEAPIQITVEFDSGDGIEAGKTVVRYEGIEIGKVSAVVLQPDMVGVIATVDMERRTEKALLTNTQFWLVKAEVSLSGVTGLGTVLSGQYITARVGDGEPTRHFKALVSPPRKSMNYPGLHLLIKASNLGSLTVGSPIIYKKITVGDVQAYQLDADGNNVTINIFIKPKYAHLVRSDSRFWNASGVRVKGGLTGFDIRIESLTSILMGGIGLAPFDPTSNKSAAKNGDIYRLYDDYTEAKAGVLVSVEFPVASGLESDVTEVVYRGISVGQVETVDVNHDLSAVIATLSLPPRAADYINKNTRIWVRQPDISLSNLSGVSTVLPG